MKSLPGKKKKKLREFITTRPAFKKKKCWKELFSLKPKGKSAQNFG